MGGTDRGTGREATSSRMARASRAVALRRDVEKFFAVEGGLVERGSGFTTYRVPELESAQVDARSDGATDRIGAVPVSDVRASGQPSILERRDPSARDVIHLEPCVATG